jgi:hypothetical protein
VRKYLNLRKYFYFSDMDNEKKEYIEGIYNYCDRWCEKCMFTSNCYLFNMESKIASFEILNNGKLPKPEDLFDPEEDNVSQEYDEEDEEEFLEDKYDDYKNEEESAADEIEEEVHPLVELSGLYFTNASELLKKLEDKYHFYVKQLENIKDQERRKIHEQVEIFGWYHAFIGAKVSRAVNGKISSSKEDDEEQKEFEEYDMNGSAKVAMISIERSINSLNALYNLLPEFTGEISELLVKAGKLLNGVEKEFPGYKNFKRPGLD